MKHESHDCPIRKEFGREPTDEECERCEFSDVIKIKTDSEGSKLAQQTHEALNAWITSDVESAKLMRSIMGSDQVWTSVMWMEIKLALSDPRLMMAKTMLGLGIGDFLMTAFTMGWWFGKEYKGEFTNQLTPEGERKLELSDSIAKFLDEVVNKDDNGHNAQS